MLTKSECLFTNDEQSYKINETIVQQTILQVLKGH